MIINLYSIYDKKAKYFEKPFTSTNDLTAKRLIFNAINDPQAKQMQFVISPSDFQIYKIGDFDDNSGQINSEVLYVAEIAELNANLE